MSATGTSSRAAKVINICDYNIIILVRCRFSSDIDIVDGQIPTQLADAIYCIVNQVTKKMSECQTKAKNN